MRGKTSILLLVLLISAGGFTLNKHYCNGELVNVFLLPHFGNCCDSSMPMTEDSCEDEFLMFVVDGSSELLPKNTETTYSDQFGQLAESLSLIDKKSSDLRTLKIAIATPPLGNIKIYLRVESFLN